MLKVLNLTKSYADRPILREVSFLVSPGERVGLIGPNGSGKTTLIRLVLGKEPADAGTVQIAPGVRVGYLPQGLEAPPGATLQSCLDQALGDTARAEAEIARLAAALAQAPGASDLQHAYAAALDRLETLSRNADPARVESVLAHLGLGDVPRDWPTAALSGGQKTRLGLALVLLANPQLLLLDEPTNHLDLDMLDWLADWLTGFRGAALIVSHDRAFLDATVTRLLELDPLTHTIRSFTGNYADYLDQKRAEVEQQRQAYADWQAEVARLRDAARRLRGLTKMKKGGKADDGDKFARGFFKDQTRQIAKRATGIEKRLARLMTEARIEKPKRAWSLKLDFGERAHRSERPELAKAASGRDVLALEGVSVGYGAPLLHDLNLFLRRGERVALIGPNGSGKTTLVRVITGQLPPLAGRLRLGASVRLGYFAQEHDMLDPALNALEMLQRFSAQTETDLRSFLHYFLFEGDEVFTPIGDLSFGERARLALATLVAQGCNFLVLDEPINHLDIPSREKFEQALTTFEGTALVIAHDRYFIQRFAARVWRIAQGTVREYADLADALRW